jgi:hypothetical protein
LITITKKVVKYFFISKTFCIFATLYTFIMGSIFILQGIQIVNQFVDEHEKEILEIWDKAQRGEKIEKIRR